MTYQQITTATVAAHIVRRTEVRAEIAALTAELTEIEQQLQSLLTPSDAPAPSYAHLLNAVSWRPGGDAAQR